MLAETLLLKQPWLMTPDAFRAMSVASRAFLESPRELAALAQSSPLSVENGVGVIGICGPMLRRPDLFSRILFNATDSEEILSAVREAGDRPDVDAVFLDIDSPGGTVSGTPELAQAVADVNRKKPVYAFSSGLMCSAAYWVGSQAQAIYVTPSARIGSIGVIQPVVDDSEALKNAGIKVEVFAAGKFKSIGTPGVPLTDAQRELIQSNIAETAQDFHDAVLARGRKIPPEAMEGQDFSGKQAQRLNLAGLVRDRAEAIGRLRSYHVAVRTQSRRVDTPSAVMSKPIEEQLQEALARIQALEADAQASSNLLTEASSNAEAIKAQLASLANERAQLVADLSTARQTIQSLTTLQSELEAKEQDIEKRAAFRAAQIVASTGTQAPAKVSPAGDAQVPNGEGKTTEELIAHFNDLIKRKQPKAAAEFYAKHIQPLFKI
jgi:signal peptide peptidase SppA